MSLFHRNESRGLHAFAVLFLALTLCGVALNDLDDFLNQRADKLPPPPHFVPKPPADAFQHSTPHRMSGACCSAGSCARNHHHVIPTHGAFWHIDLEPLPNADEDAGWHVMKAADDTWPDPVLKG